MDKYWNVMVPELLVSDFDNSLEFYTQALGFTVRFRREEPDFAYLEKEKVQLMIEQINGEGWTTETMTHPFGRGVNFQMEFEDIASIYKSLKKSGASFYRDLNESWYETGEVKSGQKEFLIQDPDGYLLRFTQYIGEKQSN